MENAFLYSENYWKINNLSNILVMKRQLFHTWAFSVKWLSQNNCTLFIILHYINHLFSFVKWKKQADKLSYLSSKALSRWEVVPEERQLCGCSVTLLWGVSLHSAVICCLLLPCWAAPLNLALPSPGRPCWLGDAGGASWGILLEQRVQPLAGIPPEQGIQSSFSWEWTQPEVGTLLIQPWLWIRDEQHPNTAKEDPDRVSINYLSQARKGWNTVLPFLKWWENIIKNMNKKM